MKKFLTILFSSIAGVLLFVTPAKAIDTVIYDALPDPLPPNSTSQPFQAQQTYEFGDYINLGGTERTLSRITVAMSTWAYYATYQSDALYMGDTDSWTHPITVNVYANTLDSNGVPDTLLATSTQDIEIPWRPEADPTCSTPTAWRSISDDECYNGFAFNAVFDLASLNVELPDDVIVSLAYNTQTYGEEPIGVAGPYNSLNVLVPPSQPVTVGSDYSNDKVFWNTTTAGWYADGGTAGVGILREDTNWTPYGTIAMKIEASMPYPRTAEITSPEVNQNVYGEVEFTAYLDDNDVDAIQWAVREGTCAAGTNTVFGNVDGKSDSAIIDSSELSNQTFSFTADMSSLTPGMYCFIYNPTEDSGESNIRETVEFNLIENPPMDKNECKKGGWEGFMNWLFKNQGDCVSYVQSNENASGNRRDN